MDLFGEVRESARYMPLVVASSLSFIILYLNSFIDQLFVNLCGASAARAYAIAIPVSLMVVSIAGIFGFCASRAVRAHWERGDDDAANQSACNALAYSTALGLVASLLIISVYASFLNGMVYDRDVYVEAVLFLLPFAVLFIPIAANSVLCSLLAIDGGAKVSFICLVVTLIANIVLDRFFVSVLGWGIFGNGLGTAAGYCASLAVVSLWFFRHKGRLDISRSSFCPTLRGLRKAVSHLVHNVVKVLAQTVSEVALRVSLYVSYALSYGVPMLCSGMASVFSFGCAPALGPRYREFASSGDGKGAMSLFRGSTILIFVMMCVLSLCVYAFADVLATLFTQVHGMEESRDIFIWTLQVLCFTAPFLGLKGVCAAAISPFEGVVEDTVTVIIWNFFKALFFLYFLGHGYDVAINFLFFERIAVGLYHLGFTWLFIRNRYGVPADVM